MGLEEKKLTKKIEDENFTAFKVEMKKVCGAEIAIDVDWNTHATMDSIRHIPGNALGRVRTALLDICKDQMGKDAVRDGIKKLTLKYVPAAEKKIELSGQNLTLCGQWDNSNGLIAPSDMKKVISSGL